MEELENRQHIVKKGKGEKPIFRQLTKFTYDQLDEFIRGLCKETHQSPVEYNSDTNRYQRVRNINASDIDVASMILLFEFAGYPQKYEHWPYGLKTVWQENGYCIRTKKDTPLLERNFARDRQGKLLESAGIISAVFQTPFGSVLIHQDELNVDLFDIAVSEQISKEFYERIINALARALDLKGQEIPLSQTVAEINGLQICKIEQSNNRHSLPGNGMHSGGER